MELVLHTYSKGTGSFVFLFIEFVQFVFVPAPSYGRSRRPDRRVRLAWSQPIRVHGLLSASRSRARMVRHLPGRALVVLAAAMLQAEPSLQQAGLRLAGAVPGPRVAWPQGAVALPMRGAGRMCVCVCECVCACV